MLEVRDDNVPGIGVRGNANVHTWSMLQSGIMFLKLVRIVGMVGGSEQRSWHLHMC